MTILIVDDNEMNLYQLQVLLGGNGYHVVTAVNGAEALATARRSPPDLIISDILMPVMDGFALCREWKKDERLGQIPFVFYTATYTDERDREFALSLGAEKFLVKPEEPEVFIRNIREVIEQFRRSPAPPAPPAVDAPARLPVEAPPSEESAYLKQYNEVLIRKLEAKMQQLEQANRELERDITERKLAEAASQAAERRLADIIEFLPDATFVIDQDKRVIAWNRACEVMTGVKKEALLGQGDYAYAEPFYGERRPVLIDLVDLPSLEVETAYKYVQRKGSMIYAEFFGPRLRGGQGAHLWGVASPLFDRDGRCYGAIEVIRDVTERKQAEAMLAHERDLLHALMDNIPDKIFFKDTEGRFVRINRAHAESLGLEDPAEAVGKTDFDVHPPEQARESYQDEKKIFDTGEPLIGKVEKISESSGKDKWNLVTKVPLKDKQGRVVGLVGTSRDITERMQTEEALRESEERFRTLAELLPEIVYEMDERGKVTFANRQAFEITGYTEEDLGKGFDAITFFAPSDQERARQNIREVMNGKSLGPIEYTAQRKDGSQFPVLTSASFQIQQGKIVGVRGIVVDITEHRRAEEARAYLASIVESSDDAIIGKSPEGVIQSWNAGAERLYGYTAAEVTGQSVLLLVPPDRREEIMGFLNRIKQGAGIERHETVRVTKDGRRIDVSVTISPLKNASGEVVGASTIARDITERKRAEEELLFKTALLEAESETMIDGVLVVDRSGEVLLANSQFARMWNIPAETMRAKDDKKVMEKGLPQLKDPDAFLERVNYLYAHETEKSRDEIEFKDGRVFDRYSSPLQDSTGKLYGRVWYFRDITERKRAEEAIRESEEKYRSLLSNIPDVVWTMNAENRFTFISKNIEKLSGFSVDEIYQEGLNPYLASLHPDDVPKVAEGIRALFAEGRPFDVEVRAKRKDGGEWIWIHDRAPATYERNGVRYADGLLSDITQRKRAEAEHVRLVTAIEQSAEGVVITNPSGDIEYVNPAFTRITGYGREEVVGRNPRILKSGKQDLAFYQQLWATILNGQTWQGELINRRKDGNLYTEQMNITPVRDESGKVTHFVATKQDVTGRKALEEHVRQAAKMEAIGRLAGGVAHDFNNLLTIINGYSELLLEKFGADGAASAYLSEVKNAGARAASLTRQLLAFSRRQVLEPQVLDLNIVVSNVEKMLKRLIGEDVKLRTVLDPSLGRVKADPGQIEQVIMNLAVNARDAMPSGGNLTLETGNVELDEVFARSHVTVKPGPHVMLAVSDTGVGMSAETKGHIFEPFFTTKEEGKGTGLGLATVYGIVKQSGGSVWVYSELGQGTVFKVYLPTVSEDPAVEAANMEVDAASGTETILVVEDQKGVRSLICQALESVGYKVLDMEDAETVLAACANYDGPIHLLLTDVVMPGLSGPLIAAKVSSLRPNIKVLYMSGYTDDAVVHHGVFGHDAPFIQKPFSPAALRKKIREVLGRK